MASVLEQQDGEDFSHANSLFGVRVASLYVAPPLYDASDFASIQPGGKSDFARYDAYLYNSAA
ncbi:hypothetical protein MJ390_03020 [Klebsiella pneumoniae]|nr:hypothetical protein MJ390_03020 [Klebsiella pneumoniae]